MNAIRLALLALALLTHACTTPPEEHTSGVGPVLTTKPVGSLTRAKALGDVYLAGQPSATDLGLYAEQGLRTVVSLRGENESIGYDERARAAELGLAYENLPYSKPEQLDDAFFARARELLGSAPRPLLVHCASGNRVGALWIPWRVLDGGIELEAAVAEARAIGLSSSALEQKAREYVAREVRQ